MRLVYILTILLFVGCTENELNQDGLQQCNIGSFESDYSTTRKDRDNAFDIVDGTTYYGYCGFDS